MFNKAYPLLIIIRNYLKIIRFPLYYLNKFIGSQKFIGAWYVASENNSLKFISTNIY